ncbi:MAG TPA: DUF2461 domain-containing protein [Myxococcaceae bacterium]
MTVLRTRDDAVPRPFTGFTAGTFRWFSGLERDNSREYFQRTRDLYDREVRGALEGLLDALLRSFPGEVRMFRPNRDVRFSPDKRPYKTTCYGLIVNRPGKVAGLYAQLSRKGLHVATGYYQMAADQLGRFRDAVADPRHGPALQRLCATAVRRGLELSGRSLATVPRGFDRDHPLQRFLAMKELLLGRSLAPRHALDRSGVLTFARSTWRAADPVLSWLDQHVGESTLPPELRWGRGTSRSRGAPRAGSRAG